MDRNEYLKEMLNEVPENIDKTQGSVVFIPISAVAFELSQLDNRLQALQNLSYIVTAQGEYLDKRINEFGYYRLLSTKAQKKLYLYDKDDNIMQNIKMGSRFSCKNIGYSVIDFKGDYYIAEADIAGTGGNTPDGDIVNINGLSSVARGVLGDTLIPARDTEGDNEFRDRFTEFINRPPFGGNKTDYINKVLSIKGVGSCKIIPIWNGGGTVKVIIQDTIYGVPSIELIKYVQNELDPNSEGLGRGIAPIGHKVTVSGAIALKLNIDCKIKLLDKYTIEDIKDEVRKNIDIYLEQLRKKWWKTETEEIINIKIACAIAGTEGVLDVSEVKLNGKFGNLITQNEEIPILGDLNIYD